MSKTGIFNDIKGEFSNYHSLDGFNYTDAGAIILITIGAITSFVSLFMLFFWIYYSWIRNTNSQNLNGEIVTRKILDQANMSNTEIKISIFYSKYWNHNKRRNTYRLRPWTANRSSIWTIMEATQQAYATSIRYNEPKKFWLLFRIPNITKILSVILAAFSAFLLIKSDSAFWMVITAVLSLAGIPMLIANCGGLYLLQKNVLPLIQVLGLNEKETKAIRTIFRVRFIFAIIITILDLIRMIVQLLEAEGKVKSKTK